MPQAAAQPGNLAGLAAAVVERYGRALHKHYKAFQYVLNSFNMLQVRVAGMHPLKAVPCSDAMPWCHAAVPCSVLYNCGAAWLFGAS